MLSDFQPITEISATELARRAGSVLEQVAGGERVVVTRHGRPLAVIVSVPAGVDVALAGSERFTLLRREAREELEAGISRSLADWRKRWFAEGRGEDESAG